MIRRDSRLSVRRQCELLGVTRSGLYYKPAEPDNESLLLQEEMMRRIDYWHTRCPYMGSRKILAKLRQESYGIGRKKVRSLMLSMGIVAVYPKVNLSKRNFKEAIVPYLLRDYTVTAPSQVWSIDITFIPMRHGHMYLTAIIDWHSRKIVGHRLSDTLDASEAIQAVQEAVARHGAPCIINSDQGSQFTSDGYKRILRELGIQQSMDGKSRWADNIMIERWFRSLKTEELYPNEYASPRELRRIINDYVKTYNTVRPHESLGYRTPDEVYYGSAAHATEHS